MREGRLRKLFIRYRERGDVEALTAVFDATAPDLMNLAVRLVSRAEEAEDLVQATFLTAIERRAKYDPAYALQPWLTGILVRKRHQLYDRGQRPIESDSLDERTPPDPAQGASDAELNEDLKQALAGLPERYRRVLLPFLHDGDRPQDIARRNGLAPGTVRVQIHRGLQLLRKALPPGYASGALVATISSSAFGRVRTQVLSAAHNAASATATAAPAALWWTSPGALAAAGIVLLGAGAWQFVRFTAPAASEAGPAAPSLAARAPTADSQALDASALLSVTQTESQGSERSLLDPGTDVAQDWILVADITGLDVAPPEDLILRIEQPGAERKALQVKLARNGRLSIPLDGFSTPASTSPPQLTLEVTHGAYAPFLYVTQASDISGPAQLTVEIAVSRCCSILTGRVSASSGDTPWVGFFPHADVAEAAGRDDSSTGPATTACDADGHFTLYTPHSSGWFAAVADGCAPTGSRVQFSGFTQVDLGSLELDGGAAIEGVAYAQGRAARGTVVASHAAAEDAPKAHLFTTQLGFLEQEVVRVSTHFATDSSGAFKVVGLTPGAYDVVFAPYLEASGYYDPHQHGTRIHAPASGVDLVSPIRVYTLRVSSEARPVPDAMVLFSLGENSIAGPTRPDGSYDFFMAEWDERHPVEIAKPGFATRELLIGPENFDQDSSLQVELERTAPPSDLTLALDGSQGPIGPLVLRMSLADSDWYVYRRLRALEGKLALGEMPVGRYRVELSPQLDAEIGPQGQSFWLPTELDLTCLPSTDEVATVKLRMGGRAVFEVSGLGASGAGAWQLRGPGPHRSLGLMAPQAGRSGVRKLDSALDIEADGRYWSLHSLPPGEYHLEVGIAGGRVLGHTFDISAGRTTDVLVDLR